MIPFRAFETLIGIITGAREKATRDHNEFMEFYQMLVGIVPDEIAKEFGRIKAPIKVKNVIHDTYLLELTVTDLMWWRTIIHDEGGRFVQGVHAVQREIWDQLNKLVSDWVLTDEQRNKLLAIGSHEVG